MVTSHVSPGVYSKIIDLSEYVQTVPSTVGFIPIISERGPDNQLIFTNASDFYSDFGEPDISYVGKDWGSGPYVASSFLEQSDSLYVIRVTSDDASFPTLFLRTDAAAPVDTSAEVYTEWVTAGTMNSVSEIESQLGLQNADTERWMVGFYTVGRGKWYGSDETELSTPSNEDQFLINIIKSGKTAFYKKDGAYVSLLSSVYYDFPGIPRAGSIEYAYTVIIDGTYIAYRVTEAVYNTMSDTLPIGYVYPEYNYNQIEDSIYEISILQKQSSKKDKETSYVVDGYEPEFSEIERYQVSFNPTKLDDSGDSMWIEDVINNNSKYVRCVADAEQCNWAVGYDADFSQPFETIDDGLALRGGSDGSLIDSTTGIIDSTEASTLMARAYSGLLNRATYAPDTGHYVDEVLDKEVTYFTIIFDGGYPEVGVKSAIKTLCESRGDCVGIIDNYDNAILDQALTNRAGRKIGAGTYNSDTTTIQFNTYKIAIYEGFTKIFDTFSGRDIWITPVYHMARIIPYNDSVGELWYAPAGFNRAAISSIKELRFNPNLSNRDRMYLAQLNPIVRFADVGDTVLGQLTSQRRPTALQDLNVVRLVLYCQKAIEQFCQFYLFEQNDAIVWEAIQGEVSNFLRVIQGRRGLRSFTVEVGATDYELKAKRIHVNITLVPVKVIEQIYLNFTIK